MANYKLLPIDRCLDCHRRVIFYVGVSQCSHKDILKVSATDKGRIIEDIKTIPDWCPLNNFVKEAA